MNKGKNTGGQKHKHSKCDVQDLVEGHLRHITHMYDLERNWPTGKYESISCQA